MVNNVYNDKPKALIWGLFLGNWSCMPNDTLRWQINFQFMWYFKQEHFIIHILKLKDYKVKGLAQSPQEVVNGKAGTQDPGLLVSLMMVLYLINQNTHFSYNH